MTEDAAVDLRVWRRNAASK